MNIKYEDIVDVGKIGTKNNYVDLNRIVELAKKEDSSSVNKDETKNLLLVIDMQNDFIEDIGTLPVPGSKKDIQNLTKFIYNNMENITHIMCTMDSHYTDQIFSKSYWEDKFGNSPKPYTLIKYEDVLNKVWQPKNADLNLTLEYLKKLEEIGKRPLIIWPYHCILGTVGHNLETEFNNMVIFHSISRNTRPEFVLKGTDKYSEMYGVIKPEYDKNGYVNTKVLEAIEKYDNIYVAGEALSHCVLESIMQVADAYIDKPNVLKRITLLTDCTSPITGYEEQSKNSINQLVEKYGIKIKKTTEI